MKDVEDVDLKLFSELCRGCVLENCLRDVGEF